MGLPPVDSVDAVLKTPEPEKGRDRVRKPGRRAGGRQTPGRDREQPAPSAQPAPDDHSETLQPEADQAQRDLDDDAGQQSPAYGPSADLREEEPQHHSIDYRA
jgi:hypothetical protein